MSERRSKTKKAWKIEMKPLFLQTNHVIAKAFNNQSYVFIMIIIQSNRGTKRKVIQSNAVNTPLTTEQQKKYVHLCVACRGNMGPAIYTFQPR